MKSRTMRSLLLKLVGQKIFLETINGNIDILTPLTSRYSKILDVGEDVFEIQSFVDDKPGEKSYHAISSVTNIEIELEDA